jgi:hypothetical protein
MIALVLATLATSGWTRTAVLVVSGIAGLLFLPSGFHLATSAPRLAAFSEPTTPLLRGVAGHGDFRISEARFSADRIIFASPVGGDEDFDTFWGEALPDCSQGRSGMANFQAMADEAALVGFADRRAFVASSLQMLWLMGDFPRLERAAPWYYGGLDGLDTAEIVIVPLCSPAPAVRNFILGELAVSGLRFSEVFRGQHAVVLAINR